MSATDELRRMLDECGVFWIDVPLVNMKRTCWKISEEQDGYCYFDEDAFGVTELTVTGITLAQAIAATVGTGTLTAEQVSNATYAHSIHADCADADWQAIADELNDTLGRGTCEADETETIKCWVKCKDEPSTERMELIHVMECSECGHTYEHVNGDYEFCPRCGRKRVDE